MPFTGATGMAEPGAACSSHEAHSAGFGDTSSENCEKRPGELTGTYMNVQGNVQGNFHRNVQRNIQRNDQMNS